MNKILLTGRATKDLELRKTQSGTSVTKFTIAVNRRFKQEGKPDADFISCVAWGKTADTMCQYLHKGSLIGIEGRVETGSYQDKDGKNVYTTEVVVENFDFLESRNTQAQPYQEPAYPKQENTQDNFTNDLDISSDDLPF